MFKYFLVLCENRDPSEELNGFTYTHIKAKTDGTQIVIQTQDERIIETEFVILKTKEEAQFILDNWINIENENPEIDKQGNSMLQSFINLSQFKDI